MWVRCADQRRPFLVSHASLRSLPSSPIILCAVPLAHLLMHWDPTDTVAILLRLVGSLKDGLYWALIVACPVAGWAVLFPVLIYLKFSKCVWLVV